MSNEDKHTEKLPEYGKKITKINNKPRRNLTICLDYCKYSSVLKSSKFVGFTAVEENEDWNILWTDCSLPPERFFNLKSHQKLNHFPDMVEICRKDFLARNLNKMKRLFPKEYNFFPPTWCFTADYGSFLTHVSEKNNQTYIIKPDGASQGKGIWITKNHKNITPIEKTICQKYISNPLLLDGYKFDFRIYVLITHCDPLRIFIYRDGLVRFCTERYEKPNNKNLDDRYVHLTNYAINKLSDKFVVDAEHGSKRHLTSVMKELSNMNIDVAKIWEHIDDLVIKTILSIQGILKQNYRAYFPTLSTSCPCFEVLGFDILVTETLKPYLLEVNLSPSFHTDASIDRKVKLEMIKEIFVLISFNEFDRKKNEAEKRKRTNERLTGIKSRTNLKEYNEIEQDKVIFFEKLQIFEDQVIQGFRRIYPAGKNDEKYDKFFNIPGTLYKETESFKIRLKSSLQLRKKLKEFDLKDIAKKSNMSGENDGLSKRRKQKIIVPKNIPKIFNVPKMPKIDEKIINPYFLEKHFLDRKRLTIKTIPTINLSFPF